MLSDAGLKRAARDFLQIQDARSCHLGTIAQLCWAISSQLRHYQQSEQKLGKQRYLPQYGELRPLAAEIGPVVRGTPCKFQRHPLQISTDFASWQRYCTALQYWASAKLCGIEQRAPPIFGRAAITLGIRPHSSSFFLSSFFLA